MRFAKLFLAAVAIAASEASSADFFVGRSLPVVPLNTFNLVVSNTNWPSFAFFPASVDPKWDRNLGKLAFGAAAQPRSQGRAALEALETTAGKDAASTPAAAVASIGRRPKAIFVANSRPKNDFGQTISKDSSMNFFGVKGNRFIFTVTTTSATTTTEATTTSATTAATTTSSTTTSTSTTTTTTTSTSEAPIIEIQQASSKTESAIATPNGPTNSTSPLPQLERNMNLSSGNLALEPSLMSALRSFLSGPQFLRLLQLLKRCPRVGEDTVREAIEALLADPSRIAIVIDVTQGKAQEALDRIDHWDPILRKELGDFADYCH